MPATFLNPSIDVLSIVLQFVVSFLVNVVVSSCAIFVVSINKVYYCENLFFGVDNLTPVIVKSIKN